jgi:hypothetical protein
VIKKQSLAVAVVQDTEPVPLFGTLVHKVMTSVFGIIGQLVPRNVTVVVVAVAAAEAVMIIVARDAVLPVTPVQKLP